MAPRYGVDISEKGIVYLIWMIFLSAAGGLVASYLLFRNLNKCIAAYNCGSRSHAAPRREEESTKQKALLGTAIGVRALIIVAVIAAIISMESFISDAGSETVSDTTNTQTEAKQEKTKQEAPKYILPGSDSKYLESSDLEKLGKLDCVLARNEIYARHGRIFKDTDIKNYFNKQSWYKPTVQPSEFKESMLNKYEQYNVNYIAEYEVSKGYRNPPQETVHKVSDVNALLYGNGDMENKKVSVPGRMMDIYCVMKKMITAYIFVTWMITMWNS